MIENRATAGFSSIPEQSINIKNYVIHENDKLINDLVFDHFIEDGTMVIDGRTWYCRNGSCYLLVDSEAVTKSEADGECLKFGAHVVAIETEQEQDNIMEIKNAAGE